MKLFSPLFRFAAFAVALSALAFFSQATGARAGASNTVETDHTTLRLVAASEAVGDGESLTLGLHFKLKPGWKVYWRSPGDAGYPPSIKWNGSQNLATAQMLWPVPHRFSILGLETLGYKDEIVYPITLKPVTSGQAVHAVADVDYLTCSNICVPYQAKLTLDLPAGPANPSPFAHLINRFAVQVPGDGTAHGLSIDRLEVLGQGKDTWLRLTAQAKSPFVEPDAFFEGPDILAFDKPEFQLSNNSMRAVLTAKVYGVEDIDSPDGLLGLNLNVTLNDGKRSASRPLDVLQGSGSATGGADISLLTILALAVLGGLILNLMPCVLPVLSIKLLSVVGHGGGEKRDVRLSFIASAAGILFAFLMLAATLVALKSAGMTIGWGIQFQQPWFLIAMTLIITLFACNLWGLYEFRLPYWMSDLGERTAHVHGLGGHFLTGCFATLLATPCSAPFLGTAIGFALARNANDIFAVFAALGVGLALPYLLVAALPGMATRLPRPGQWMVTLRKVMGLALAATGIWLLSVLSTAIGVTVGISIAALMAGVIVMLYMGHRTGKLWQIGGTGVAVLALLAFAVPSVFPNDANGARILDKDPRFIRLWKPFDPDAIPTLVADGKTVFVDVTADWCLTCQVNKAFVLAKDDMLARLSAPNVVAMQADWTLPDDAISVYLASFGRYGIPFNAVYGPGLPSGFALPELLSHDAVADALTRATSKASASVQ
jgi:suppressor for copper-sensitivity B